jgi:hypothetical protein
MKLMTLAAAASVAATAPRGQPMAITGTEHCVSPYFCRFILR